MGSTTTCGEHSTTARRSAADGLTIALATAHGCSSDDDAASTTVPTRYRRVVNHAAAGVRDRGADDRVARDASPPTFGPTAGPTFSYETLPVAGRRRC